MLAKDVSDRLSASAVLQALRRVPESALAIVTGSSETVVAMPPEIMPTLTRRASARPSELRSELASIAVLPLRTLSGDKDEAQIAEGLVAELTRALSGVPGISVASPLISMRFKALETDITEMARSLKIQYLLTGSIQKAGNRVRVIAELDDTLSGLQLWSQAYDRTIEDFFTVQDELAHLMAAGVSGQIIRARAEHAIVVPDEAADAMVLVRRVYHSLNTAYRPEALFEAVSLLRRAIQLEPRLALAHSFLGFFLCQLFINNISTAVEADRADAFRAVQTALRLAPGDAEVLENCGIVLIHCGKHAQAEQTLRRSVELASINLVAWGYLGLYLGWCGETEAQVTEAHAIFDRILKTAPDHPSLPYWFYFKGGIYARQGWNEKALEYCGRSVSLQPSFPASLLEYSNALGKAGRFEEALELVQQVAVLNPRGSQEAYMRELLITTGSRERAQTHIAGLVTAGIFQGGLQWPLLSKPDPLLERVISN
jgi:adenylate cyclase